MLEEEEVEVPAAKEAGKMDTDETSCDTAPSATETDVNMQDAKSDTPGAENGVPGSGDKPIQMETDAKVIRRRFPYNKLSCSLAGRLSKSFCKLNIWLH